MRCEVLVADLSDPDAPRAVIDVAAEQQLNIDVLVNNAGMSGMDPFADTHWKSLAGEIQVMVTAPTVLWQQPEAVVREGWDAVNAGKPVCVPGIVNKVISHAMRPVPYRAQYAMGRKFNPFKQ